MLRWLITYLAMACWCYLLVGGIGLLEGVAQWLRFDVIGDQPQPHGLMRLWLPYMVLYGWFGVLCGLLVMLPASLLALWRSKPRRLAFTVAVSGALAALAVVYAAYLGRFHYQPDWWGDGDSFLVNLVLGTVWLAVVLVVFWPVRRLAGWMTRQRTRTLVFPLVVIIVSTGLWPDWRQEGKEKRTGHLTRAVAGRSGQAEAPHLILISVDTWRRDHLALLDPTSPPTPHLDALAEDGLLFTNTWSVSPWTLPSMATAMTGLPPRALRVHKYVPLPDGVDRLAEVAWRQGYRTVAVVTNPYLTSWYGFDRGFEVYLHSLVIESFLPARRSVLAREANHLAITHYDPSDARHVVSTAVQWLQRKPEQSPLFLWVHLMDPHLPYTWSDWNGSDLEPLDGRGHLPDLDQVPDQGWFAGRQYKGVMHIRKGEFVPDLAQQEALRTLYSREVQYSDHYLGRLFAQLNDLGLWQNAMVVVMSDHGEEFWEHGGFEHGHSVMPEVVGVPLIIRLPGGAERGLVVDSPVTTLDLLPTLCQAMGWPVPPHVPGTSLLLGPGSENGLQDQNGSRLIQMENLLYDPQQMGWLRWPWLGVVTADSGQVQWFDLARDPGAYRQLDPPATAANILAQADSLGQTWEQIAVKINAVNADIRESLPEDIKRRLKSLGY